MSATKKYIRNQIIFKIQFLKFIKNTLDTIYRMSLSGDDNNGDGEELSEGSSDNASLKRKRGANIDYVIIHYFNNWQEANAHVSDAFRKQNNIIRGNSVAGTKNFKCKHEHCKFRTRLVYNVSTNQVTYQERMPDNPNDPLHNNHSNLNEEPGRGLSQPHKDWVNVLYKSNYKTCGVIMSQIRLVRYYYPV